MRWLDSGWCVRLRSPAMKDGMRPASLAMLADVESEVFVLVCAGESQEVHSVEIGGERVKRKVPVGQGRRAFLVNLLERHCTFQRLHMPNGGGCEPGISHLLASDAKEHEMCVFLMAREDWERRAQ